MENSSTDAPYNPESPPVNARRVESTPELATNELDDLLDGPNESEINTQVSENILDFE